MAIRSGRFSSDDASGGLKIIQEGKTGAFRVFNSGKKSFTIRPNGASTPTADEIVVPESGSADFDIGGAVFIQATPGEVEGIYDYIGSAKSPRSGRFSGNGSGNGLTIIQERGKVIYRVLNSGNIPFDVNESGTLVQTLQPTFSIDTVAGPKVTITGGNPVEGIYDYIDAQHDIRSGRFNIKNVGMYPHKIIDVKGTNNIVWYRIFNSGDADITIEDKNSVVGTVSKGQSFDFKLDPGAAKREITVRYKKKTPIDPIVPIEGIYDCLS